MHPLFHIVLWWGGLASSGFAVIPKFAAIFADHMVVQRGVPIPVWGWADPHAK